MSDYPTRPVVTGTQGMVVCPHHLASQAGLAVLQQGGHAVDAAIAINSTLGVVYPHMTGIGGDSFWLIYDVQTQQVHGLNGSGRSAQAATRSHYHQQGLEAIPTRGPLAAITVPGTISAWAEAHQRWGRLSRSTLLAAAIAYAEQGYPVTVSQADWTRRDQAYLRSHPASARTFLPGDRPAAAGDVLLQPNLAQTLHRLANQGWDDFYHGQVAHDITTVVQAAGGLLTAADFAAHTATWVDPIATSYRGHQVIELPPNTQGLTVLQILNLIEGFDFKTIGADTADYYHLIIEATKLAFADRDRWVTDPEFTDIPLAHLISKAYAAERRSQLDLTQAAPRSDPGIGGSDTTYSAVVDAAGNAVSMIQSLYFDFGSAFVAGDTGVLLQNRGSSFQLGDRSGNRLEPRKRPFHTLIPALVLDAHGRLELVLGTMGGEGQPQTQIALLTRILDFGDDPQTAIDRPRWLYGRTWGEASSGVALEGRIDPAIAAALTRRGHVLRHLPAWSEQCGHAHVIRVDPATGTYQGGCDPRSDGIALGWS